LKILVGQRRQKFNKETEAGIPEAEAKKVILDKDEGLRDTKMKIQEQASNGVDSVPFVVFEGKRRDITIQGANEVEDYVKALEKIVKESS
jgi:predicted DsbA family dithiol-disulfide isomerase